MAVRKVEIYTAEEENDLELRAQTSMPSLTAERIERLSRAQILQRQLEHVKVLPDATIDDSSSSSTEFREVECDNKVFPPGGVSGYDQDTLSVGLFNQYQRYLGEAFDVFQETKCLPSEATADGMVPSFTKVLNWVIIQIRSNPEIS